MLSKILCAGAFVVSSASADVLISNLDEVDVSSTVFGDGTSTQFKAAGVLMPADDYTLDGATLLIDIQDADANPRVSIWTGDNNGPISELLELDDPALPLGISELTFTGEFTFLGDTIYWVYVEAEGLGNFRWISTNVDPSGIATHVGYNFNGNPSSFRNKYELSGTLSSDCPADLDDDGDTDADDFFAYLDAFASGDQATCNLDGDNDCDADDFFGYLDLFAQGC